MVVVTDKQYYMDDTLIANLELMKKREEKKHDNVLIIDGPEGYGKSTFASQIGYYYAKQSGKGYSVDNFFFDLNKMIEFASSTERQIIVFDEACLSLMGTDWARKSQKLFKKMLMISRKKGHFWILIIPQVVYLSQYFVVDRAIGLVHVYSTDEINRGNFCYFNKQQKNNLYYNLKKTRIRNYKNFTFRGKFVSKFCIDEDAYEKKKDVAIDSILDEPDHLSRNEKSYIALRYNIAKNKSYSREEKAQLCNVNPSTISDWGNLDKEYPEIVGLLVGGKRPIKDLGEDE